MLNRTILPWERRWCSGIMQDSHSCDPGSIPGRRKVNLFFFPPIECSISYGKRLLACRCPRGLMDKASVS